MVRIQGFSKIDYRRFVAHFNHYFRRFIARELMRRFPKVVNTRNIEGA